MRNLTLGGHARGYLQGAAGRRGVACRRDRSNTCRAASSPPAADSRVFQGETASRRSSRSRSRRGITAPTWSLPNPSLASSVSWYRRQNPVSPAAPPLSLPSVSPALPVPAPTFFPPFVPETKQRHVANIERYRLRFGDSVERPLFRL